MNLGPSPIEIYVTACANEAWVDRQALRRAGLDTRVKAVPARVSKLIGLIPNAAVLVFLGWALSLAWPLMAPFFFLWRAIAWRAAAGKPSDAPDAAVARTWLFFSDGLGSLAPSVLNDLSPGVVLMGPHHLNAGYFPNKRHVRIQQLARASDYPCALLLAVRSFFAVIGKLGVTNATQSYTAFEWFMCNRIMARLYGDGRRRELVFVNHFDRWAVLIDRLPALGAKVLVQHGSLPGEPVPTRLRDVTRVIAFSDKEAAKFRRILLAPETDAEIKIVPAKLQLAEIPASSPDHAMVLLIGDPFQIPKDVEIAVAALSSGMKLDLFVKPHPRFPDAGYRRLGGEGAVLVRQSDFFPKVDACICGVSTLGSQYESAGIPVIWHAGMTTAAVVEALGKVLGESS